MLPHWAYCGSARRYWDFVINGKLVWGNEREFHHYGSTLNAIPILDHFRAFPSQQHLLRLGGCALMGHLSLHAPSGAASMAWHGDPALLKRDAYSGDYGIGMYGYWRSAGAYLGCAPPHGWVCLYCEIEQQATPPTAEEAARGAGCAGAVRARPRDPFGRRVYVAPLGLSVAVEGAVLSLFSLAADQRRLSLELTPHERAPSSSATLRLSVERVEPPPPASASAFVVRCMPSGQDAAAAADCVRRGGAPGSPAGEYLVAMPGLQSAARTLEIALP